MASAGPVDLDAYRDAALEAPNNYERGLPREASPAEVASEGEHDNDEDDDPEQGHGR